MRNMPLPGKTILGNQNCVFLDPYSVRVVKFLGEEVGNLVDGDTFLALGVAFPGGDGVVLEGVAIDREAVGGSGFIHPGIPLAD